MQDHRKLKAFSLADQLVIEVYRATRTFPREEMYGLTRQMRRSAVSVAANIVEGCARETMKEYINFLNISFASLRELGYYFDLSLRLGFLKKEQAENLTKKYDETARVLSGLINSLRRKS
jgi:four helix bundle protein